MDLGSALRAQPLERRCARWSGDPHVLVTTRCAAHGPRTRWVRRTDLYDAVPFLRARSVTRSGSLCHTRVRTASCGFGPLTAPPGWGLHSQVHSRGRWPEVSMAAWASSQRDGWLPQSQEGASVSESTRGGGIDTAHSKRNVTACPTPGLVTGGTPGAAWETPTQGVRTAGGTSWAILEAGPRNPKQRLLGEGDLRPLPGPDTPKGQQREQTQSPTSGIRAATA